jgi:transcriptional regulator with XRE-family HTH domain
MSSLKELLHSSISKSEYLKLSSKLKISQKKLTRGENNPAEFSVTTLRLLSKILGISTYNLIRDYGVAVNNITLKHFDLLQIQITPINKYPHQNNEKSSINRANRKQARA